MDDLRKLQSDIAARHEQAIATEIARGMRAAINSYEKSDVVALPVDYKERLAAVLENVWSEAARLSGKTMFKDRPKADEEELLYDRIIRGFVEEFGSRKVTQISDATRAQLMRMVRSGVSEGQTLQEIAKAMREAIPEISRLRSHVIARTETHGASNYSVDRVARTSRVPLVKVWVATEDSRTRDFGEGDGEVDSHNHRAMDGVKVGANEPFMVPTKYGTKEPLMYPGDPGGTAGNVIMCRCVVKYERAE
jgi:hypothetical protein